MRLVRTTCCTLLAALLLIGTGCSRSPDADLPSPPASETEPSIVSGSDTADTADTDVPYVPTPPEVVTRMLEMADVSEDDVVYDLGSGDGRIVIAAAKQFGARGVGIEIDPARIEEARQNAEDAGVADQVEFRQQDLFEADISEATAVTLYLLPTVNLKLRPILFEQLAPGTPVVSHDFDMDDWEPEKTVDVGSSRIYRWTIPAEVPAYLQE
jgi:SAM-dependent methyltransferase